VAISSSRAIRIERKTALALGGLAAFSLAISAAVGCASTEFGREGPGQPDDKQYGAVPIGMVGVCKRPFTLRPPIVNPVLWEHAKTCRNDTDKEFLRLGYGHTNAPQAKAKVDRMMEALRQGQKPEGNSKVLTMLRSIRQEGLDDPWLKDRVNRESTRTSACDFTYLLNTMEDESTALRNGDRCAVYAYDQVDRQEVCLFDTQVEEGVWFTSTWACTTRTGTFGKGESCHKLCDYDDYCARQVSCVQPDVDLGLCALGVCTPEEEAI
jgi:hypothetical protein